MTLVLAVAGAALPVVGLADADVRDAAERALPEIYSWEMTPKLDIGEGTRYEVYPDGRPTAATQGGKTTWLRVAPILGKQGVLFAQGNTLEKKFRKIEHESRRIRIRLGKPKPGTEWTRISPQFWATFEIRFDRALTADDFAPQALAQALSGFFDIEGNNLHSGGAIAAKLEQALEPIDTSGELTRFEGLLFRDPPGWTVEPYGRSLFYRRPGSKAELKLLSVDLGEVEAAAGPEVLFAETYPDRAQAFLGVKKKHTRLTQVAAPALVGGLVRGQAEGVAKEWFRIWYWLAEPGGRKVYELVAYGKGSDAPQLRAAVAAIAESVGPVAGPAGEPGARQASLPDPGAPEARSDAYAAAAPAIGRFSIDAAPERVRRGERLDLVLRFELVGPDDREVAVDQSWTLSFDGSPLPTYPTRERDLRGRGAHEVALEQVIPTGAALGVYRFEGEACVQGECASRTTRFEVVP